MRLASLIAAAAVMGTLGWSGAASAQSVGFGFFYGPPSGYADYSRRDYPRNYYYDAPVRRMIRPGGCGTYRYWNGERCVDARYER